MTRLLGLMPLTALLAGAVSAVSSPAAGDTGSPGRFGIRLVDAPVARRHDPRARTGIVDHLAPGTTIRRRVEVVNMSRTPQNIQLYAAAAAITNHKFTVSPDRTPNELSRWISPGESAVTIPPWEHRTTRITINVPPTASKGERYAVIWASDTAPPDSRHNIGATNRVGIPVYLDVGPGGEPPSDMRIERLTPARAKDGRPEIVAQLHNTGGRALTISGTLWLSDGPGGLRAGPYAAERGVALAPGESAPVAVILDRRLPKGPWKARLTLQSGMLTRTVSAPVTFPDSGIGRAILLASATRAYAIPAAAGLLFAGATTFLVYRRRRRSRR
ncbi:hypothetical protein [Actinoallomurus acaciae]|uniref:Peptidase n=1 Tax=Actinoallomurus acaciae TaxID=502577 RepID=A0ABV5YDB0_9ACTN